VGAGIIVSFVAAGQTSMSMMVGWMGVMVGDGDRSRASSGEGGRRNDGGGVEAACGLAVAEAVSEGGRGVDVCVDGEGDGADLGDGDRRTTSATRALSVSLSSDS